MQVDRYSSFCREAVGGNPAGVVLASDMMAGQDMLWLAVEIGCFETAFAMPEQDGFSGR
jgi:predicted PhzF superfamily epimerase YddE/YHI9